MNKIHQLHCDNCGGCIPLIDAPSRACVYCGAHFEIPAEYVQIARSREATKRAREQAEPKWKTLSKGVPQVFVILGGVLMVLLPPISTYCGHLIPEHPLATPQVFAFYTVPSLLPGAFVYTFSTVMKSIGRPFQNALSAIHPADEKSPPLCRSCNASLDTRGNDFSVTCAYCGTDSLLQSHSMQKEQSELGKSLDSLESAIKALQRRRVRLLLGISGAFAFIFFLSLVIANAFYRTI